MTTEENQRIRSLIPLVPLNADADADLATVETITNSVANEDTLVVYFMSKRIAAAWVREPGKQLALVKLTDDVDSLIEEINTYSNKVRASISGWQEAGVRLHAKIIAPLGPLKGKRIIIVPSLMMERIPFDALGTSDTQTLPAGAQIVILSNLMPTSIVRLTEYVDAKPVVIGINGEGLSRAVSEAKEIAKSLGVEPITGGSARIDTVGPLLSHAPIVHLATHATLDMANPFASRIEMSDPLKPIAGWWLFSQPMNAKLITLSACQTAEGSIGKGEIFPSGIYNSPSFAEIFHQVGVRFVVGTMWSVDDALASVLMIRFYEKLKKTDGDPSAALSDAKRAVINEGKANAAQLAAFQISVRSLADLHLPQ